MGRWWGRRCSAGDDIDTLLEHIRSDAYRYLQDAAMGRDRYSSFYAVTAKMAAQVESSGRWESEYEWRMATEGRQLLEKLDESRYRARTEDHGIFEADFASFGEAYEAVHVFVNIQHDLLWAVGWASWAAPDRMEPGDPPTVELDRSEVDNEDEESEQANYEYLARLSGEAQSDAATLVADVTAALRERQEWSDTVTLNRVVVARSIRAGRRHEVEASCRSLTMSASSPTAERALEFAGIYARLQDDLAHYLEWEWL